MSEIGDSHVPRRQVIDLREPARAPRSGNRTQKRGRTSRQQPQQLPRQNPLEMTPVIEAVQEYGRRTHSIGALQGAHAIQSLVDKIRGLGSGDEDLKKILADAEDSARELRSYLHKVYSS